MPAERMHGGSCCLIRDRSPYCRQPRSGLGTVQLREQARHALSPPIQHPCSAQRHIIFIAGRLMELCKSMSHNVVVYSCALENSTTLGHCCAPPGHWLRTRVATINSKPRISVSSTKQATPAGSEETRCFAALTDSHSCNTSSPSLQAGKDGGCVCVHTVHVCVYTVNVVYKRAGEGRACVCV